MCALRAIPGLPENAMSGIFLVNDKGARLVHALPTDHRVPRGAKPRYDRRSSHWGDVPNVIGLGGESPMYRTSGIFILQREKVFFPKKRIK